MAFRACKSRQNAYNPRQQAASGWGLNGRLSASRFAGNRDLVSGFPCLRSFGNFFSGPFEGSEEALRRHRLIVI